MQITLEESLDLISKLQTKFNNSGSPKDRYAYVAAIEKESKDILDSITKIKEEYHNIFISSVIDIER